MPEAYTDKPPVWHRLEAKDGNARAGVLHTQHGDIPTPVFMPVGTVGSVKALTPRDLKQAGARIILGNAYHLYLRPGHQLVEEMGGLHRFAGWDGAILTDSGGFQVMSLSGINKISEGGVEFASHIDGSKHMISPERSMEIQRSLGSDIVMCFDDCPPYPAEKEQVQVSMERTIRWSERCLEVPLQAHQGLFGIQQGGMFPELREQHSQILSKLPFAGYAIGGLSVGERPELMHEMVAVAAPLLPENKARYLMGVGRPQDLVEAVGSGVDMFDCVMPTRNARNGQLFTSRGKVTIKNAKYINDSSSLDESCRCYCCANFTKAYLRHLYIAKEPLYMVLNTLHNITYYLDLMSQMRAAIIEKRFDDFRQAFYKKLEAES